MVPKYGKSIVICEMRSLRRGFILFAKKSSLGGQENGGIANIVLASDGRDFRWRGGGMRREDEQRQDRKRRNDIDVALVRQREDRLPVFHAVLAVSPPGASGTMTRSSFAAPLSEIRVAVDLASDQSVGRVLNLPNGH